jgi:hypothetical protein
MAFDSQFCRCPEGPAERDEECQVSEGELEAVTDAEHIAEKYSLVHLDKGDFPTS